MPLSDNVDYPSRQRSGGESARRTAKVGNSAKRGRRGIPVDLDDAPNSILSPILSHFPSFSGIPTLKGFLPSSPSKRVNGPPSPLDATKSIWQHADLEDGWGKLPLLLITSRHHALQIFTIPQNVMPDDIHVQEIFPPPEELFSLPVIRYDDKTVRTAISGEAVSGTSANVVEEVLEARLLEKGRLWREPGPLVACVTLTSTGQKRSAHGNLALIVVSLRTGTAIRRVELGVGKSVSLSSSARALAISVSYPVPTLHLLHPFTLAPLCSPISDLFSGPRTGLPTFALSGRLLAYATAEPPSQPGPDHLGSLVTGHSLSRAQSDKPGASTTQVPRNHVRTTEASPSSAVLTSAVEIGGGVARGVWAGIKMGARVADRARNSRLATSAPTGASFSLDDDEGKDTMGDGESRSLDESSLLSEPVTSSIAQSGAEWIKVIDIAPQPARSKGLAQTHVPGTSLSLQTSESKASGGFRSNIIAHFRMPPTASFAGSLSSSASRPARRSSITCPQTIPYLSFSPSGTQLFASTLDGRAFHVVELHPAGATSQDVKGECKGEAWRLYELRRGNTSATVCQVTWDSNGRWIGVGTESGTIHVFPISPAGGPPSSSTHAATRFGNSLKLNPLCTVVRPVARLRPHHISPQGPGDSPDYVCQTSGMLSFTCYRRDPLDTSSYCQDIALFWPSTARVEIVRLSVTPVSRREPDDQNAAIRQRRPSALTEMIFSRAASGEQSDLSVAHTVKARWLLPLDIDVGQPILTVIHVKPRNITTRPPLRSRSLAHAEIQTHCTNPRILPSSIYLSRQMDFHAAKPIDDYSPLSILDIEARTRRLVFRHEVEARPGSPEVKSFDEPLFSALHSCIESPPESQIPGLPNGYPVRNKWRTSMPIRQVAAGLGEGVDRVRREYVRAQYSRSFRRESEAAANQLSFEEDAVFASETGDEGSSPSSGVLPESSVAEEDREEPDGWGEGWEEEYRRAVEDDGGPDDLVLGLLDEKEERRKWGSGHVQKALARQYLK